jgi:hypothetical protein
VPLPAALTTAVAIPLSLPPLTSLGILHAEKVAH